MYICVSVCVCVYIYICMYLFWCIEALRRRERIKRHVNGGLGISDVEACETSIRDLNDAKKNS